MSIGREALGRLLTDIVSDSVEGRQKAAQTVSDWSDSYESFDLFEARVLVRVLAVIVPTEVSISARDDELNALTDLVTSNMAIGDIAPVLEIPSGELSAGELDYVQVLRESITSDDPENADDDHGLA